MDESLIELVWTRAHDACEYCLMPQDFYPAPFQIDHIIAKQHDGPSIASNLALSCLHCNSCKGPNIAGRDKPTRRLTPLFNPRRHRWERHFRWDGPYIVGRTPIGRVTVAVLNMNDEFLVRLREELILG
ncbi:MAG: HNH endonuclease [Planctomycetes bacterium]|nr:HNH endonuclease [Planctomycetota bacterium]